MLAYLDSLTIWLGEPINGIRHPLNIGELWSDQELADVGLGRVTPFFLPPGHRVIGSTWLEKVEGVIYERADVEAIPPAVPAEISDRQFFQALALSEIITNEEALLAVKVGEIPAALSAIVNSITDPVERFSAEMLLSGATIFRRDHPLTAAVGTAQGISSSQIDDFFIMAGQL